MYAFRGYRSLRETCGVCQRNYIFVVDSTRIYYSSGKKRCGGLILCAAVAALVSALFALFDTAFAFGFTFIAVFTTFAIAFIAVAFIGAFIGAFDGGGVDAFPRPGDVGGQRATRSGPPDGSEFLSPWRFR